MHLRIGQMYDITHCVQIVFSAEKQYNIGTFFEDGAPLAAGFV